jgi:hypothetical protein
VSRLVFFLLLIATVAYGAHLWLSASVERADFSARERNRDEVRIVGVTPPVAAARVAEDRRRTIQALAGAACVEFSGVGGADAPRVREAFAAMRLGDRVIERRVEEATRHWVYIPPARDRRAAEVAMAQLKRQGVTEMSIRPDNAISLGVFSSEDAARRFLAALENRGIRNAESAPFARELRELVLLVREPDTETVARLALLQRDYPTSTLRAVACPEK